MSVRERIIEVGDYVRVRHHTRLLPGIYELKAIEATESGDRMLTVCRIGRASPRFLMASNTDLTLVQRSRAS